jgi:hypothetical protein
LSRKALVDLNYTRVNFARGKGLINLLKVAKANVFGLGACFFHGQPGIDAGLTGNRVRYDSDGFSIELFELRVFRPRHEEVTRMANRVPQERYRIAAVQHGLRGGKNSCLPKLKFAAREAGKNFGAAGCEFLESGVQTKLPKYTGLDAYPRHAVSRGAKARGHPRGAIGGRRNTDDAKPRQRAK